MAHKDEASYKDPKQFDDLLAWKTLERGRPKALCYEGIQMMVVRHPVAGRSTPAMTIKFIHHNGADNKPKPYVLPAIHLKLFGSKYHPYQLSWVGPSSIYPRQEAALLRRFDRPC